MSKRPILIGNISGSTGDRADGLLSMLRGETKVDAITGDWLSEANLPWRAIEMQNSPDKGYEPGFFHSLKLALNEYLSYPRTLKIVVNAGGLNPKALALKVQNLIPKQHERKIAYITGDNVLPIVLASEGTKIQHLTEQGESLATWMAEVKGRKVLSANAYTGCWAIVEALNLGADIVIVGRCTDASPVIGLAAYWHGWKRNEFDKLAKALVAGHLVECGGYATGGNFPGFKFLKEHVNMSFPIAEISDDGTAIIQKQPDQNGQVSVDTIKGQFLYELQGPFYYNPDVIAHNTNIHFTQVGPNKVRVGGVLGLPAPSTAKVAILAPDGWQAEFSIYPTGLDIAEKVASFKLMTEAILDRKKFTVLDYQVFGTVSDDPQSQQEATVQLRVFGQAQDKTTLEKPNFYGPALSNLLQGFPALTPNLDSRTAEPKPFLTYFPGLMDVNDIQQSVHFLGNNGSKPVLIDKTPSSLLLSKDKLPKQTDNPITANGKSLRTFGQTVSVQLGKVLYARSGDKGANVNIGFYWPEDNLPTKGQNEKWEWIRSWLSTDRLRDLLAKDNPVGARIDRCEFPNSRAVHFVIHGVLGRGVTSTSNIDSLGKNVAEFLRARRVDIPAQFVMAQAAAKL